MKKFPIFVIGILTIIIICLLFIIIILLNDRKENDKNTSDGTSAVTQITTSGGYTNVPDGEVTNSPAATEPTAPAAIDNPPKVLKTGTPAYINEYGSDNVLKSRIAVQKFDILFKAVSNPDTNASAINADITVNGYCANVYDETAAKAPRGIVYNVIGPDGKPVYQGVLVTNEIGTNDKFTVAGEIDYNFENSKTYKIEFEEEITI